MSSLVTQLKGGSVTPAVSIERRMKAARTKLLVNDPFFGSLILGMPLIWTEVLPTMATDGKHLFVNPTFVEELASTTALCGILVHEGGHKAFFHHLRRGNRNPEGYNIAGDVVINWIIEKQSKWALPESALRYDTLHEQGYTLSKADGTYSTEQLYAELKNQNPEDDQGDDDQGDQSGDDQQDDQQGDQQGDDQPSDDQQGQSESEGEGKSEGQGQGDPFADPTGTGIVIDAENDDGEELSEVEQAEMEQSVLRDLQQAAATAQKAGKLPAWAKGYVEDLRDAKIDWSEELVNACDQCGTDSKHDWKRLDKKMLRSQGLLSPRRVKSGVGNMVVAFDTSGSVLYQTLADGTKAYEALMSEVITIAEDIQPSEVTVIYCDSTITQVDTFEDASEIDANTLVKVGGGGTRFDPPFDYVAENDIEPDIFIYLSDLEARFPSTEPDYPVIWVSTTKEVAPWGQTITLPT